MITACVCVCADSLYAHNLDRILLHSVVSAVPSGAGLTWRRCSELQSRTVQCNLWVQLGGIWRCKFTVSWGVVVGLDMVVGVTEMIGAVRNRLVYFTHLWVCRAQALHKHGNTWRSFVSLVPCSWQSVDHGWSEFFISSAFMVLAAFCSVSYDLTWELICPQMQVFNSRRFVSSSLDFPLGKDEDSSECSEQWT